MRTITQQKGFAPSSHDLCCFGGAVSSLNMSPIYRAHMTMQGGQHACAIAKGLGVSLVVIPRFSSVLSAYGIACADITTEALEPLIGDFDDAGLTISIAKKIVKLRAKVVARLLDQEVPAGDIVFDIHLGCGVSNLTNFARPALMVFADHRCHYDGSDTIMQVPLSGDIVGDFIRMHLQETSFNMDRPVLLANVTVLGKGASRGELRLYSRNTLLTGYNRVTSPQSRLC